MKTWIFPTPKNLFGAPEHCSALLSALVTAMTLLALIPLFSFVWMLVWRGGRKLSVDLFTHIFHQRRWSKAGALVMLSRAR